MKEIRLKITIKKRTQSFKILDMELIKIVFKKFTNQ